MAGICSFICTVYPYVLNVFTSILSFVLRDESFVGPSLLISPSCIDLFDISIRKVLGASVKSKEKECLKYIFKKSKEKFYN